MDTREQLRRIEALLSKPAAAVKVEAPATSPGQAPVPIAIVGIAASFPKCASVTDFWRALEEDRSLIGEIGPDRFDWEAYAGDDVGNSMELRDRWRWAGLMERPFGFDAEFFGVLEGEAELMDPRQRLLMMSVYHCLEDAGVAPGSLRKSSTGLFVGAEDSEYGQTLQELGIDPGLANLPSMIANRIAYHYDLAGASEFVNTLCSSGAVAIHRACNALRSGEIAQALVGAAHVLARPEPFWRLAELEQLSPESTVNSFGRQANGYLRADGVGTVMLKTLSQAEKDGDAIYALIRHSSVNFSGQGGMSMATPNIGAHVNLIKQCYRDARIDPRELDYIEAQGMGTPVSDIAEWNAFNRALAELAAERGVAVEVGRCAVSTVKPMMGHMHAASAFGALFKIIHGLRSETIYRIRGLADVSPELPQEAQPCRLLQENSRWPRGARPRLAALHSYGLGGNNAHLLVEEYMPKQAQTVATPFSAGATAQILPFSARSPSQCRARVEACRRLLDIDGGISLAPLAHTLQAGRDSFDHRVVFVASSVEELAAQMDSYVTSPNGSGPAGTGVWQSASVAAAAEALDLASRWARGERVQWSAFSNGETGAARNRVRLPGYPFALTDYRLEHEPGGRKPAVEGVKFSTVDAGLPRPERVQRFVALLIAQALRVDVESIDLHEDLQNLGIDSIVAFSLLRSIQNELDVKLGARELREASCIEALALQIESKLAATDLRAGTHIADASGNAASDQGLLESLEKFKRGELDIGQIKQMLN